MDHEEIKEAGFLTRPPFTLPSSTRPREAKRMMNPGEYVMRLGLKSSVRSRVPIRKAWEGMRVSRGMERRFED